MNSPEAQFFAIFYFTLGLAFYWVFWTLKDIPNEDLRGIVFLKLVLLLGCVICAVMFSFSAWCWMVGSV